MAQALSTPQIVSTDREFLKEVLNLQGDALDRCYQCGTCSVVCPITPEKLAFPRKEMIWAQWGMKDRLLQDPDVWLCHQCNDCNTHCPRDARPGDLMAALRNYHITHYAAASFLAKPATNPAYLPLAFIIPLILVFGIVLFGVILPKGGLVFPEGRVMFAHFIPSEFIDVSALMANTIGFIFAAIGATKFWRSITQFEGDQTPKRGLVPSFMSAVVDIFSHRQFKDCTTNQARYPAHAAIFYGFLFLFAATTGAFIYTAFLKRELSLPLYDPVKIIGNLGFLLMLGGLTVVSYRRMATTLRSIYFDWFFIGLLYVVILTGFFLQALRLLETGAIAYSFYLVHLVLVYTLYIYLPFSKFAHLVYRTAAMTWARRTGRVRTPENERVPVFPVS